MRAVLRRGLKARGMRVVGCRRPEQLSRVLQVELVEAVVVAARRDRLESTVALASRFPRVPVFLAGPFRPDDAPRQEYLPTRRSS